MYNIHTLDIVIIILYFLVCIGVGLYKYRSVTTLKEYALGGKNFPDLVIVTTLFATYIGSSDVLGIIEKVYELGLFFVVALLFEPFFWVITSKLYGSNIEQFQGCLSISDIMNKLYGNPGRWITNISSLLISIVITTSAIAAMGYIVNHFLQISINYSISISAVVLGLYSASGGIRAVTYIDVFQFMIIIIAIPAVCFIVYGIESGGGITEYYKILTQLPTEIKTLNFTQGNIGLFLSLIFYSLLPLTEGTFMQRFLLSKDSNQLTRCLKIIPVLHLFFIIAVCLIGFFIKVKEPNIDPNTAFIYFIANYLCVGIKGIVTVGLLSIIMSTADSWLNTTSVLVTHDIVKKLIPLTEKQAITIARLSTFGVAGLAVLLSLLEKGIMELEWLSGNFWATLIIVPLTAGFLKFWTNSKSFIASVILAILFTCISGYIVGEFATISLMCGMVGSAIGLFGMHYWQKRQGTDTAKKHRELAAIDAEKRNNIAYANSADQIEEWYNENRGKIKKIEFILEEIRK